METGKPFSEFSFHKSLQTTLDGLNFTNCTPIQEQAMPHILEGKDVAGLAQTGTGKTAAFLLPMIERVLRSQISETSEAQSTESKPEAKSEESAKTEAATSEEAEPENGEGSEKQAGSDTTRAFTDWKEHNFNLVLVPTRELAEQVKECAVDFLKGTGHRVVVVYGGVSIEKQIQQMEKGYTFLIATPGRLIDHFKSHRVDLKQVRAVIFDEADRMFDMGFKDDMKYILRRLPDQRQLLLFSATLNLDVFNVAYQFGSTPVELNVSLDQATAENVDDFIFHLGTDEKPQHLLGLLNKEKPNQVIVFTNFKNQVDRIAEFLNRNGHKAAGISSLMNQNQRQRVMARFRSDSGENILVATDVAARGLDIEGVDLVVNFELPDDAENYVHRIGRTGRAGEKGKAFSFVSDKDVEALARINNYLDEKLETEWMESEDLPEDYQPFPKNELYMNKSRGKKKTSSDGRRRKTNNRRPRRDDKDKREDGEAASAEDGQRKKRVHRDKASGRHRSRDDRDEKKGGNKKRRRTRKPGESSEGNASGANKKKRSRNNNNRRRSKKKVVAKKQGFIGKVGSAIKKLFG